MHAAHPSFPKRGSGQCSSHHYHTSTLLHGRDTKALRAEFADGVQIETTKRDRSAMAQKTLWQPRLASRILQIPGSGIREVMSKSMALRDAGKDVINWHIGRPDFDTPSHIKSFTASHILISAVTFEGHVHYAPAAGIPQLRSALAERASQEYESAVDPDRFVVCNGGMEAASRLSQL
eukprot:s6630_g1.t2